MTFFTRVAGIPCQCLVVGYQKPRPMKTAGTGFGDAEPPEPEEFEFRILDQRGRAAPWLERKLTDGDHDRLLSEYKERSQEFDNG